MKYKFLFCSAKYLFFFGGGVRFFKQIDVLFKIESKYLNILKYNQKMLVFF